MTAANCGLAECVFTPDRTVRREAGIPAGLLPQPKQAGRDEQCKPLNDLSIFPAAAKESLHGTDAQ